jgi:uncharacterized membrane protein YeaQ/YmgE (transglycosylase-associated protein family)
MDIAIWALLGAVLGCGSYSYLGVNEGRGIVVAGIIGAVGGVLGGTMVEPLFTATAVAAVPGDFNTSGLVFAALAAAALLALGDVIYKRWRV